MKTRVHVVILTVDGSGQLVAVLKHQNEINFSSMIAVTKTECDVGDFTVTGDCLEDESPLNCAVRIIREDLGLLPSKLIEDRKAQKKSVLQLKELGEGALSGSKRLFFGLFVPNASFLKEVILREPSGGLYFSVIKEELIAPNWSIDSTTGDVVISSLGINAKKKAFRLFGPTRRE